MATVESGIFWLGPGGLQAVCLALCALHWPIVCWAQLLAPQLVQNVIRM